MHRVMGGAVVSCALVLCLMVGCGLGAVRPASRHAIPIVHHGHDGDGGVPSSSSSSSSSRWWGDGGDGGAEEHRRTKWGAQAGGGGGGLQAVITEAGVAAVQRALRPQYVDALLASFRVPPVAGSVPLNVLGFHVEVDYSVTNVSITNVTFTQDEVDIVPLGSGAGVNFSVADGAAEITADFAYKIPSPLLPIQGSGQAIIDVSKIGVQLQVNLYADAKGYPQVSLPQSSIVLGQFNTKINNSGILEAILQFFLYLFNGTVRNEIQTALNSALVSALSAYDALLPLLRETLLRVQAKSMLTPEGDLRNGTINELIRNQSLFIGLPPNGSQVVVDVSLPTSPSSTHDYILVPVKGEVFMASGQHSNYTPVPMPPLVTNQMLQLSVNTYLFNTAGWAYYKSGLLNYMIDNSNLPSWFPFPLNTASFKYIIPKLYSLYPDLNMNLDFFVSEPIGFAISNQTQDGVGVRLVADTTVNVIASNGSVITVFDLQTTFKLHFKLYFNGTSVHGKLDVASFNTTIKSSQIGSFDVSVINFFLDAIFDNVLLFPANLYLSLYPLFTFPSIAGFYYVNPTFVYSTDFVTLSADFANDMSGSVLFLH